jgi:hypothetical protein
MWRRPSRLFAATTSANALTSAGRWRMRQQTAVVADLCDSQVEERLSPPALSALVPSGRERRSGMCCRKPLVASVSAIKRWPGSTLADLSGSAQLPLARIGITPSRRTSQMSSGCSSPSRPDVRHVAGPGLGTMRGSGGVTALPLREAEASVRTRRSRRVVLLRSEGMVFDRRTRSHPAMSGSRVRQALDRSETPADRPTVRWIHSAWTATGETRSPNRAHNAAALRANELLRH